MKEMVILPTGKVVWLVVSDYWFDASVQRYEAEIYYGGAIFTMHFYNNFWA